MKRITRGIWIEKNAIGIDSLGARAINAVGNAAKMKPQSVANAAKYWHNSPVLRSAVVGAGVGAGTNLVRGMMSGKDEEKPSIIGGALMGAGIGAAGRYGYEKLKTTPATPSATSPEIGNVSDTITPIPGMTKDTKTTGFMNIPNAKSTATGFIGIPGMEPRQIQQKQAASILSLDQPIPVN